MSIKTYVAKAATHAQPPGCRFDIPHRIEYASKVRTPSSPRFALGQLLVFALLAFQLAFGLAQSAGAPHPDTAHHDVTQLADSSGGSVHAANGARDASMTAANDAGSCPLHAPAPDNKHDCCKSSACQCQCGYVSLAVNLDGPRGIPASTQVQPIARVRFVTAPADTLFRPPIRA